jgi:hypothetical protein
MQLEKNWAVAEALTKGPMGRFIKRPDALIASLLDPD